MLSDCMYKSYGLRVVVYCWISDDNLAPSTEYDEEIATVTQFFLSEMQLSTHITSHVFIYIIHMIITTT